ncbi:hypothetical protein TNCV_162721, partial [Trichonephila clavipes]
FEEGGFSYRTIRSRVQRNSSTVMRVWKQWTTEGDVSARRPTPVPHGGEGKYSFLQREGSMLVYYYTCTNVGFVM